VVWFKIPELRLSVWMSLVPLGQRTSLVDGSNSQPILLFEPAGHWAEFSTYTGPNPNRLVF